MLRISGGRTKEHLRIGRWNVRSLFEAGKIASSIQEMKRLRIDSLGISETSCLNSGQCQTENAKIFYSGNDTTQHLKGVGGIVSHCVLDFVLYSDRDILLKFNARPIALNIIHVYAHSSLAGDGEVENLYSEISEVFKLTKPLVINIIMGGFSVKVGNGRMGRVLSPFGLGVSNERGGRLVQFSENYRITNTWFSLPPRRLYEYTWKSRQDNRDHIVRDQIEDKFHTN